MPTFPGDDNRWRADEIEQCSKNCVADDLSAEDLDCWMEAPCGAVMGRNGALKPRLCQLQRSDDAKGKNNTKLAKAIRNTLYKGTRVCEKAKAGLYRQFVGAGVSDKTQIATLWSMWGRNFTPQTSGQREIVELKKEHWRLAIRSTTQLDTPLLTSACKLALAEGARDAHKHCLVGTKKSPNWIKKVGKKECAGTAPDEWEGTPATESE